MIEAREELLISHVVDGDATDAEWRELQAIGDVDPMVWRRLAEAQRHSALLSAALGRATLVAERINLPSPIEAAHENSQGLQLQLARLGGWTGWAVAAVVAVAATVRLAQTPAIPVPQAPLQTAGFASAAQAFQAYLDQGRESGEVVGEVPGKVLVDTKPAASGTGYEVIYLRQVMERTVVPDLYQLTAQDEAGRPTLVRYQPPVRNSM